MTAPFNTLAADATSIRGRLQRGLSWNIAGAVIGAACNLALSVFIARILGKELFGQYGMLQNTIVTAAGIAQLATGYTATRYVAEFRSTDKAKTGRIIGLCSAVATTTAAPAALALVASAGWLASTSLHAPQLAPLIIVASIAVFFATLNGYQMGTLAGLEEYRLAAGALATGSVTILVASVTGARLLGLSGVIVGGGLGTAVQWLAFRLAVQKGCARQSIPIRFEGMWEERRIIARFAVPASVPIFLYPATWAANALLARQPDGFAELAIYNAAASLRGLILFLPLALNRVCMSLLNHEMGQNAVGRYRRLFLGNLALTAALVLMGTGAVIVLGPSLLLAFGKPFRIGYPVLVVVLLATALEGITQPVFQIIQTNERMWLSFWTISLPRDGVMILLAFWLIPKYGALGLAFAVMCGAAIALASTAMTAWRLMSRGFRIDLIEGTGPEETVVLPSSSRADAASRSSTR